ncbi:MAG: SOS response-associated peptidase [Acidimicrobiia bacterium]|nr:SOS response-associated peptidase [Acidimicrobiia bacterium]
MRCTSKRRSPITTWRPGAPARGARAWGCALLERQRWGLVPSWAKDAKIGDRMINARAETVASKPAFRSAFAKRRCIVPADGFYEWQVVPGRRQKQPYFFYGRDGAPLAFAGMWELWRDPSDAEAPRISTFVIVTTSANALVASVHERMPVVLPDALWDAWLDSDNHDAEALEQMLLPAAEDVLLRHAVGTEVNRPQNHGAGLVEPLVAQTGLE